MPSLLLGVSGSIAAFKVPEILRFLIKQKQFFSGIILTQNARQFVSPLVLEVLGKTKVYNHLHFFESSIPHLSLAKNSDALVVLPCTATAISKFANAIADDLLSATFLSFTGPKLLIPAMHSEMIENPIVQNNIARLKSYGVQILDSLYGELSSGDHGYGRMASAAWISNAIETLFLPKIDLSGKKILISMGGTREDIDSVRFISNRSTGKLGEALAFMAKFYGANVSIISTNPLEETHFETEIYVESAAQMQKAVLEKFPSQDALIMVAAVSDFSTDKQATKLKRRDQETFLTLKPSEDILKVASKQKVAHQKLIGFCLEETEQLDHEAKRKLNEKGLDFIVANTSDMIGKLKRTLTLYSAKNPEQPLQSTEKSLIESAHFLLANTLA